MLLNACRDFFINHACLGDLNVEVENDDCSDIRLITIGK